MFDLRYHVASLTAVFFALVIGILVGVALASHAQERVTALTDEGAANAAFVREAYTAVMSDRLQGRRIAVLFIGKVDRPLLSSIDSTLDDAGAPAQRRLRALTVPIDDKALNRILRRRKQLASYAGPANLANLGRELAHEFVVGGDTPLWDALENNLVEEKSGRMGRQADGVVVVRNAAPQANGTATFLSGLYSGLADS